MFILQSFIFNSFLAKRALFPACLGTFVSPDVNILTGEKAYYFRKYILQKIESLLLPGTINITDNSPPGINIKRTSGA